jgi:hypothetical protein
MLIKLLETFKNHAMKQLSMDESFWWNEDTYFSVWK